MHHPITICLRLLQAQKSLCERLLSFQLLTQFEDKYDASVASKLDTRHRELFPAFAFVSPPVAHIDRIPVKSSEGQ